MTSPQTIPHLSEPLRLGVLLFAGATLLACQQAPEEPAGRQVSQSLSASAPRSQPSLAPAAGGALPTPKSSASTQDAPCAAYPRHENPQRWLCHAKGAPVDIVSAKLDLRGVIHEPTPVLVIERTADGATGIISGAAAGSGNAEPAAQAICVLAGAYAGITGFVAPTNLHTKPCPSR